MVKPQLHRINFTCTKKSQAPNTHTSTLHRLQPNTEFNQNSKLDLAMPSTLMLDCVCFIVLLFDPKRNEKAKLKRNENSKRYNCAAAAAGAADIDRRIVFRFHSSPCGKS